jgi:hypothetical protein
MTVRTSLDIKGSVGSPSIQVARRAIGLRASWHSRRETQLGESIAELRQIADGQDEIMAESAGVIAGWWFANTVRRGEELIAAGLLMLARHVDLDDLDKWVRVGWATPRINVGVRFRRKLTPRSHEKGSRVSTDNSYPMTFRLLTSSNGTVVLPPIWVS